MNPTFRERISNDIIKLNELHQIYSWIPNENQIRPKKNILKIKLEKLSIIKFQWRSLKDYIDHVVWDIPKDLDPITNTFHVTSIPTEIYKLQLSEFPYNTVDSVHYVLWFADTRMIESTSPTSPSSPSYSQYCEHDELINQLLNELLLKQFEHDRYSFAWYVNPKMSVPDYFHVQVFVMENCL